MASESFSHQQTSSKLLQPGAKLGESDSATVRLEAQDATESLLLSPPKEATKNGYRNFRGTFVSCKKCRPEDPCRMHGGKWRYRGRRQQKREREASHD